MLITAPLLTLSSGQALPSSPPPPPACGPGFLVHVDAATSSPLTPRLLPCHEGLSRVNGQKPQSKWLKALGHKAVKST